MFKEILILFLAYLFGSIPSGVIVAKFRGINLREVGSGNIGATNVTRAMGKSAGAVTLIGDALKGLLPILIAKKYVSYAGSTTLVGPDAFLYIVGLVAVFGHIYPIFLKFKGGKGVATAIGILLGLTPWAVLIMVVLWLVIFGIFRISSLSALAGVLSVPVATYFFYSTTYFYFSLLIPLIIFYTHRENIKRLIRGEERGFSRSSSETS